MREGDPISEFMEMDQPVPCYYNGKCKYDDDEKNGLIRSMFFTQTQTNGFQKQAASHPQTHQQYNLP